MGYNPPGTDTVESIRFGKIFGTVIFTIVGAVLIANAAAGASMIGHSPIEYAVAFVTILTAEVILALVVMG